MKIDKLHFCILSAQTWNTEFSRRKKAYYVFIKHLQTVKTILIEIWALLKKVGKNWLKLFWPTAVNNLTTLNSVSKWTAHGAIVKLSACNIFVCVTYHYLLQAFKNASLQRYGSPKMKLAQIALLQFVLSRSNYAFSETSKGIIYA